MPSSIKGDTQNPVASKAAEKPAPKDEKIFTLKYKDSFKPIDSESFLVAFENMKLLKVGIYYKSMHKMTKKLKEKPDPEEFSSASFFGLNKPEWY